MSGFEAEAVASSPVPRSSRAHAAVLLGLTQRFKALAPQEGTFCLARSLFWTVGRNIDFSILFEDTCFGMAELRVFLNGFLFVFTFFPPWPHVNSIGDKVQVTCRSRITCVFRTGMRICPAFQQPYCTYRGHTTICLCSLSISASVVTLKWTNLYPTKSTCDVLRARL